MFNWIVNPVTNTPEEMRTAETQVRRRIRIDRYRSRTTVTNDDVVTAYSWLGLGVIRDDAIVPGNVSISYITKALSRGVETNQAVEEATGVITGVIAARYAYTMLTFNTSTNAAASEALLELLTADENYTELNVRTMVTAAPNHKIRIFKRVYNDNNNTLYVMLNNMDTPAIVFKVAAAIMWDLQHFGDYTNTLAQAYLNADGTAVCSAVTEYYREFNAHAQERALLAAFESMEHIMCQDRSDHYVRLIDTAQSELDDLYARIADATQKLNQRKADYLMYKLNNEDQRVNDLKQFLMSVKQNLSEIKVTDSHISFVYRTPLLYFEPQAMQRYFDSTRPNVVKEASAAIQQLLKDVFINQTHQFLFETGATLNLTRPQIQYYDPGNMPGIMSLADFKGMPNPHHRYYNCWGDNQSLITQALVNHDYVQAILQTIAAMAGINITDTAVIEKFVRHEITAYRNTPAIFVKATNETITYTEYMRRYNDASNENEHGTN